MPLVMNKVGPIPAKYLPCHDCGHPLHTEECPWNNTNEHDAIIRCPCEARWFTEAEFKAAYPDRAFTWDLDEHPDDDDAVCACRSCRELSYEG